MTDDRRVYEIFNLNKIISEFPPDPQSEAKRRAEILVKSDTLRVVLITAVAGSVMHDHSSPGPITIQILNGQFTMTTEGEERVMEQGDIAIMAPDIRHEIACNQDGAFLLTIAHLSRIPDTGGEVES